MEETITTIDDTMNAVFDRLESQPEEEIVEALEDTVEPKGQPEEDTVGDIPESEEVIEEATPQAATPPESWTKEAKAKFNELPEWAQSEVLKREGDFLKGIEKHTEKSKFADAVNEVVKPYEGLIAQEGGNAIGAIQQLLQTAALLRTGTPEQKQQVLNQIATQYGVNIDTKGEDDEYVDPDISGLRAEIADLKSKLYNQEAEQKRRINEDANKAIEDFASQEGHEYFEEVRQDMSILLRTGKARDLADAYEQATWLNKEVREKVLADREAKKEKERLEAAKKEAKEAKKRAGANLKTVGGKATVKQARTWEETVSEAYDRAASQ